MTVDPGLLDRLVLPRWREWTRTARTGELAALTTRTGRPVFSAPLDAEALRERRREVFLGAPTVYTAGDMLSAALVEGSVDSVERQAAELVLAARDAPAPLRELAERVLSEEPPEVPEEISLDLRRVRARVATLRRVVQTEPQNAVRWADLALAHAILGQRRQAAREMTVAVSLAGDNRFIVRAAARHHIFQDDPDAAHAVLLRSGGLVAADPWVMAAEIAVAESAGRSSKNMKRGFKMLEREDIGPQHLTELASALATMEMKEGNARQARRLFTRALEAPNGNSLAQLEWAAGTGAFSLPDVERTPDPAGEAPARHAVRTGDRDAAVRFGMQWLADQPYAAEPAIFVSYQASVWLEDYKTAQRACEQGLLANPTSRTLKNNLAVALAHLGEVEKASEVLAGIHISPDSRARDDAILRATQGLVAFRQGDIEAGRAGYQSAVTTLRAIKESDLSALAAIMWAREELAAHTAGAAVAFQEADRAASNATLPEVREWQERLRRLAHPSARTPELG